MRILQQALTFDDVLLLPGHSNVLPGQVELRTRLTHKITLNIPLLSAAMDTVTESALAITLAQEGGLGVIHKNLAPQEQAKEVARVKRYESGILKDPITVEPHFTVRKVLDITRQHNISGLPVVKNNKVEGIVTNRDLRFESLLDQPVAKIMTPRERLVVVREGVSIDEAKDLLHRHRLERVLVVDGDFNLKGLITVKDILKSTEHPKACKDEHGRLRVGAAVGVSADTDERVELLVGVGVDVLVLDTAHGHSQGVLNTLARLRKNYPEVNIIAGNVATKEGALALVEQGVDAVKVGIGPGSICTTRIVTGVGVPQITAVANIAEALKDSGIPIIADGGVRYSGDMTKALAAGAHSVMVGGLFAGTDEAPGEIELFQGRSYKVYRGMGSIGAMRRGSADRYSQSAQTAADKFIPEGIEGRVPYKGPVGRIIHQLVGALQASLGYLGCQNLDEVHKKATFVQVTLAGMRESHVHDVEITKEAPNYWVDQ